MPRFYKFPDADISFVNDRRIVEVNDVVVGPSMIGNSGAFGHCLHISNTHVLDERKLRGSF